MKSFLLTTLLLASSCASTAELPVHLTETKRRTFYGAGTRVGERALEGYYVTKAYQRESDTFLEGLGRRAGDVLVELVPPIYVALFELSDETAVVRHEVDGDSTLELIDIGTNTRRPIELPGGAGPIGVNWSSYGAISQRWTEGGEKYSHSRVWITCPGKQQGAFDVVLLEIDGSTQLIAAGLQPGKSSAKKALESQLEYIVLNTTGSDGRSSCTTYSKDGQRLAGPLRGVERLALGETITHPGIFIEEQQEEVVAYIGDLPNTPDPATDFAGKGIWRDGQRLFAWDSRLYQPLSSTGTPVELPAGVVGLMRLVTHVPGTSGKEWTKYPAHPEAGFHSGWAVVFENARGQREFGFSLGSATDALASATGLERYSAWEQANLYHFDDFGDWQPARAFARRVRDKRWIALDLETMDTYGSRRYGQNLALVEPMTNDSLIDLKRVAYDVYDENGSRLAALHRSEVEQEELGRAAAASQKRIDDVFMYIAEGRNYSAHKLLVDWDLGEQEKRAWVAYYNAFGCKNSYEIGHARSMGMDADALALLGQELATRQADQAAMDEAMRLDNERRAAWEAALSPQFYVEKVEIDYMPNGTARIRTIKVPQ